MHITTNSTTHGFTCIITYMITQYDTLFSFPSRNSTLQYLHHPHAPLPRSKTTATYLCNAAPHGIQFHKLHTTPRREEGILMDGLREYTQKVE